MVVSKTLLIKHLPNAFDKNDKEQFLKFFGAKEVKCIDSKINKYSIAFARFETEYAAEMALHRLHQTTILGSCLSVEFAKEKNIEFNLPQTFCNFPDIKEKKANEEYYKQFMKKLSYWQSGLNFQQPVPCHLKYQYPPPTKQTIYNIIKVLVTVPKFYTQVLHLMNKMNLPCPFVMDILPNVDLNFDSIFEDYEINIKDKPEKEKIVNVEKTTSESEISSDEEMECKVKEIIPQKQEKKMKKRKIQRRLKSISISKNPNVKKTKFEDVFEKSEVEPKKIKVNYITSISGIGSDQQAVPFDEFQKEHIPVNYGFGYICPVKKGYLNENKQDTMDDKEEEKIEREKTNCISEAELSSNRIPEKDRSILPVFKNYAEGAPTCRLYIKNLAKTVTDADLKYIYNRYQSSKTLDEPNMFDIRLMQEGRMKGQAFVTLQSVDIAQRALKETNGYILKDKPLVVQFARSSK